TVSNIGISNSKNVIDAKKLQKLVDLSASNYNEAKDLLGLSRYDVEIIIEDTQNKSEIAYFGIAPTISEKITVITRFALYNEKRVLLKLKVFEE
ncbi:MAG: hypothetical protein KAS30_04785, partial [Candidatus Diapherotrites archaeon]|nr:hypothetical protein [Candidatus Diapherotrites archaeon]